MKDGLQSEHGEEETSRVEQALLAVGVVVAATIALVSFYFTVAPAGLESGEQGATFKQVTKPAASAASAATVDAPAER
jgi:hypothetical protein